MAFAPMPTWDRLYRLCFCEALPSNWPAPELNHDVVLCCVSLVVSADAPDEPDKPRRKLNFRRLLLNKCQEEFEKGDVAMAAVAAREKKKEEGGEEEDKVCCLFFGVRGEGGRLLAGLKKLLVPSSHNN
jgi:hypothetical protein